jgi:hypothetical protein
MKPNNRQRGLILIQIDGLAEFHLEQALKTGRLPFLKKLLAQKRYRIHPLYPGVPSTTPAVQGELFYGVRAVVPAFSFRDHESKKIVRMYDPAAAAQIEQRLRRRGDGLLKGGSSYSDIFSGESRHDGFCTVSFDKDRLFRKFRPAKIPAVAANYLKTIIKSLFLMGLEAVLALVDFFRGILTGKNLFKEMKFIASRIAVTILLRDLAKSRALLDIKNGVPVIHLNFLGYDEHAHRRGPSSRFAYWTLKGIDAAVKELWNAAARSKARKYDVWVYSDHGQEDTTSYYAENGKSLQEAVTAILTRNQPQPAQPQTSSDRKGIQSLRSSLVGGRFLQKLFVNLSAPQTQNDGPAVAAMGPLGHIYLPGPTGLDEKRRLARKLVESAGIPLVLAGEEQGRVIAWNPSGEFFLPEHAAQIVGRNHQYREAVAEDLIRLCRHPDAGTFIISGWRPAAKPLSFPVERGAHGGPGRRETDAFALLPPNAIGPAVMEKRRYLRIADLREAVNRFLKS